MYHTATHSRPATS